MQVLKQSGRAYKEAVNQSILGAVPYYLASAFMMQLYIFMSCGSRDLIRSQVSLGLCGEITILMSSVAAAGVYSFLGYETTHISICVIFLLMGIGLDDM